MSRSAEYDYYLEQALIRELERQRRRERQQAEYEARRRANEERIRSNTERFYQRYLQQYEEMQSQNFESYIPQRMARLRSDLNKIESLLYADPGAARDISMQVGDYIYSMMREGHQAEREFRRREIEQQQRQEAAAQTERVRRQGEIDDAYYEIIGEISSQAVVNFAAAELSSLREQALRGSQPMTVTELRRQAQQIIAQADAKAKEYEIRAEKKEKKQIASERLQGMREQLEKKSIEDSEKAQELLEKITALQQSVNSDSSRQTELEQEIEKVEATMDDTLISEDIRREAVKSVVLSLRKQGFQVKGVQLINKQGQNYVKVIAQKPSGKRVQCRLDLHGKLIYKFDEYEGMTCLKDIEQFNVELEKIYSVKLSDERVIWENPDRLSKDAHSANDPKRRNM